MAQPYVGEIRMFAGTYAPLGWELCHGQQLSISENDVLFQLIGTTYGGDGVESFALPDLRGRIPVHQGQGFPLGSAEGVEEVTLSIQQIPVHSHPVLAVGDRPGDQSNPAGNVLAQSFAVTPYLNESPGAGRLNPAAVVAAGGSQPHTNLQPYLCVNFIISLVGLFPSPT